MRPELGPPNPVVGQTYAYDLYAHCSGEYAVFGGGWWHTATPPGNPVPTPRADGSAVYDGYLAGWMTLISGDTAIFAVAGSTATFVYNRSSPGYLCD
jgi:hypothetical protein